MAFHKVGGIFEESGGGFLSIIYFTVGASCTKGGGEGSVRQIGTEFVVYTESTLSV